jgi:hypothetical protein
LCSTRCWCRALWLLLAVISLLLLLLLSWLLLHWLLRWRHHQRVLRDLLARAAGCLLL